MDHQTSDLKHIPEGLETTQTARNLSLLCIIVHRAPCIAHQFYDAGAPLCAPETGSKAGLFQAYSPVQRSVAQQPLVVSSCESPFVSAAEVVVTCSCMQGASDDVWPRPSHVLQHQPHSCFLRWRYLPQVLRTPTSKTPSLASAAAKRFFSLIPARFFLFKPL